MHPKVCVDAVHGWLYLRHSRCWLFMTLRVLADATSVVKVCMECLSANPPSSCGASIASTCPAVPAMQPVCDACAGDAASAGCLTQLAQTCGSCAGAFDALLDAREAYKTCTDNQDVCSCEEAHEALAVRAVLPCPIVLCDVIRAHRCSSLLSRRCTRGVTCWKHQKLSRPRSTRVTSPMSVRAAVWAATMRRHAPMVLTWHVLLMYRQERPAGGVSNAVWLHCPTPTV